MEKKTRQKRIVSVKTIAWSLAGLGMAIVGLLVAFLCMLSFQFKNVKRTTEDYVDLKISAMDVQLASDYLTDQARSFVVTGEDDFVFNYFKEKIDTKRREKALEALHNEIGDIKAYKDLDNAVDSSVALENTEYYAMRLTIVAFNKDYNPDNYETAANKSYCQEIQNRVMTLELKSEDAALSIEEQKQKAVEYVYGSDYQSQKHKISANINASIQKIDELLEKNVINSSEQLNRLLIGQQVLILFLVIFFTATVIFIRNGLMKPINYAVSKISNREFLDGSHGLKEYRYLVAAYNEAREVSINNAEKLTYIAEHDKLTGVLNRMGYESVYRDLHLEKTIFILVDLDDFKAINDNHGHHVGDRMLKKISGILTKHFPNDYVCRIGGDEFAILIFDYKDDIREQLEKKFEAVEKEAENTKDKLPKESLSIGVAFGTKDDDTDSLYRKADRAMYHVKSLSKSGYCFYDTISKD